MPLDEDQIHTHTHISKEILKKNPKREILKRK